MLEASFFPGCAHGTVRQLYLELENMRGEACNTLVVLLVRCPNRCCSVIVTHEAMTSVLTPGPVPPAPDRKVKVKADYPHRTHQAIVNSTGFQKCPDQLDHLLVGHGLGPPRPSGSRD